MEIQIFDATDDDCIPGWGTFGRDLYRTRFNGVPGVIYGDGKPPLTVSVDHAELKQRIYAGRFLTTVYELDIDGAKHRVIPRDFQLDPVRDLPVHVDFLRLGAKTEVVVTHEQLPESARESHSRGWTSGLEHLDEACQRGFKDSP